MRALRAAVIGTGFIGPVHIEAIRRLGHAVVGVLGSSSDKSVQAAQRWHIPTGYSNIHELIADPSVDVVHITSPNRDHFAQASACLQAGKHVICEKPLAMNSQETAQLMQLAQASGLVAAVNYNVRFYPLCLEARARVRQCGRLFQVVGSYLQDWLLFPSDYNWRVEADAGGELRAVADIGTHWLDLIQFITGKPVIRVCADLQTVHLQRDRPVGGRETFVRDAVGGATESIAITTEDCGSILFHLRDGGRGCVSVSQVMAGKKNQIRFDIATEKASFSWNSENPNFLEQGQRETASACITRDPSQLDREIARFSDYPAGHAEGFPDTFKQLFRAVYDTILDGTTNAGLYPTFEDGHREVVLCEAILKSQREQSWVNVPESDV